MLITTLLKSVWGRIRYRDLHSMAEFCVWYKPCGRISNYSFPSGHTAAISVILCFLQWKHNPYERVSLLRYVLVAGGIALMAISRMMMGAHFLSDTIAGFLITYTLYLIWKYHFRKRGIL
jgi:membrane-associated phospholipid phosphatase